MKPQDSKRLDIHEPIPGLAHLCCDRFVPELVRLNTTTRPGIFVGLMLAGAWRTRSARDDFVFRANDAPIMMTMETAEDCTEHPLQCGRLALSSVFIDADFLSRMSSDDPTGQIAALRTLTKGGFRRHTLRSSDQIASGLRALVNNPYRGAMADLYTERYAGQILFDLAQQAGPTRDAVTPERGRALAQDARDMITAAPDAYRSVSDMARQLGTNPTTLRRAFQDAFGQPIFEFVSDYRMEMARDLLRDSPLQIAQIAYRVGYRSPSNFTTAYRRRFGHSPAHDRRAHCA